MEEKRIDEELSREFEWAKEHVADDDVLPPCPDELEKILEKVESKRKDRYS